MARTDSSGVDGQGEIKRVVISCHSLRSDHVSLPAACSIHKELSLLCDTVTPTTLWLPSFMPSAAVRQTALSQWRLRCREEVQRNMYANHRHTCFSTWLHLDSVLPALLAQGARQVDCIEVNQLLCKVRYYRLPYKRPFRLCQHWPVDT